MKEPTLKTKTPEALPKKLGYRTPDRFRRKVFRRNPALDGKIRSFGGHR
jgi:hypothetical protein